MKLTRLITIFLLASFLLSCNSSEECREETDVKMNVFLKKQTEE